MWLIVLLIVSSVKGGEAHTRTPSNAAVVAGQSFTMHCATAPKYKIHWYHYSSGKKTDRSRIYNAEAISAQFRERFSISFVGEGHCDLTCTEARFIDAGIYECHALSRNNGISSIVAKAELIVLALDPVCTTNTSSTDGSLMEGESVALKCSTRYAGNWAPSLEWWPQRNGTISASLEETKDEAVVVTTTLTTQVDYRDHEMTYACMATFTQTKFNRSGQMTNNIPQYEHQCNITMNIKYGPLNLSIQSIRPSSSRDQYYRPGDRLVCSANGNPKPTYSWKDHGKGVVIDGPLVVIDETMIEGQPIHMECTAANLMDGQRIEISQNISLYVAATIASLTSTGMIIGAALGGMILTAALVVVHRHIRMKWRYKKERECAKKPAEKSPTPSAVYDFIEDSHSHPKKKKVPTATLR